MCRGTSGQAFAETLIALSFLMMVILALVQFVLLASTRHIVNYAAFAGARAALYGGESRGGDDQAAVQAVARTINWGRPATAWRTRDGLRVVYPTTLGLPLFNSSGGIVSVAGLSPVVEQPFIPEVGDNADR